MTPLVYLDTETTQLDPRLADVIEAAWAVDDGDVNRIVFDHTLNHADPAALAVNRYWERGLDQYADPCPAAARNHTKLRSVFLQDLTGATIVAENYGFDTSMLLRKLGFEPWHYRKIELSSVAMIVFNLDRPESMHKTADRLRGHGVEIPSGDHTAEGDVECLRACYLALRQINDGIIP